MEEIEDQLDSDEDDTAFLVTSNSGTGGNDILIGPPIDAQKQTNELEQFGSLDGAHNYDQQQYYDQNQQHDQQAYHNQDANKYQQYDATTD